MQSSNNSEEFYTKLKSQLYETSSWPTAYLFKFIVTSDQHKVDAIESVFDNLGAVINSTASKKRKLCKHFNSCRDERSRGSY